AEREELESRLLASEAALAAARAQQAAADAERARRTIRAPFAGIIERRTAAPGSMVQPGDEVLTLVDARTLELEAALPADASPRVRVGARVRASTSGAGAPALTGTIVRIAPALDPVTRQLRVTIAIANPQGRLPIGAFVEGTLVPADSLGGR
nr:efflux RND transporter periplasmic adaptor subunit [Gemmatimonadaceae bacterium]